MSTDATRPAAATPAEGDRDRTPGRTVCDATFAVLRERGLTTIFSSPGSAEVPLLAGLPDDLRFVLALHEGSVVGPATGHAPPAAPRSRSCPRRRARHRWPRSRRRGSTAPPVVVLVGRQDRRHPGRGCGACSAATTSC